MDFHHYLESLDGVIEELPEGIVLLADALDRRFGDLVERFGGDGFIDPRLILDEESLEKLREANPPFGSGKF